MLCEILGGDCINGQDGKEMYRDIIITFKYESFIER